jgi:hypothetical protein
MDTTIIKGNSPLLNFSFATRSGGGSWSIPSDPTKYVFWIHDNIGIRQGAGPISNINTSAKTCQYQSAATDWVNACVATIYIDVDLGEPTLRTFFPQKVLIEDKTQA